MVGLAAEVSILHGVSQAASEGGKDQHAAYISKCTYQFISNTDYKISLLFYPFPHITETKRNYMQDEDLLIFFNWCRDGHVDLSFLYGFC